MKKTLAEILRVSVVFRTLTEKRFNNFSVAYKIAQASKELDKHCMFYGQEERKIVEEYAVRDEKTGQIVIIDGNHIKLKDNNDMDKFNQEIGKLQQTEVDVFEPIEIHFSDFKKGELDLTPSDIINLEGFVHFIDDDVTAPDVIN